MFIDTIGIILNFGKTQVYETSVKSPMIVFETMIETMAETNIRIERITNFWNCFITELVSLQVDDLDVSPTAFAYDFYALII